ncbi:hypothetical protein QZH41_004810 [Actinostola sp. cb2023]|nr:hypothetical protein QZH41_004810 [Actinostola sp. cb2023]
MMKVREVQCEDRLIHTVEHQEKPDEVDASESSPLLPESIQPRCIPEEELYADDYARPLECLYKALISPVLHKLTKDEIVIIPDGPLFNVPFAALQDPDNTGSFLSETKRIRLAPSLTSLKALQESPADFHSKAGALIIGNPQVGEVMFRGKKREISGLPCAEQEAQMIGKLLGVKPFIGPQATKEAIKQNLQEGVAIIHFAAHGTTDGEIFLTPSTTGGLPNEQDYILTMKDVQESGVRPQLVVLSCCHSGRGEVKAEGVVGMSRAFLAAGARAVVASLWAIADEATMVFMEKFYKHLKEGESASKSLQQAMKDMRGIPSTDYRTQTNNREGKLREMQLHKPGVREASTAAWTSTMESSEMRIKLKDDEDMEIEQPRKTRERSRSLFEAERPKLTETDRGVFVVSHADFPRKLRTKSLPTDPEKLKLKPWVSNHEQIKKIIHDIFENALAGKMYNYKECNSIAGQLAAKIKDKVSELQLPNYKLACTCMITKRSSPAPVIESGCVWDCHNSSNEQDAFVEFLYKNEDMYAMGTVYGVHDMKFDNTTDVSYVKAYAHRRHTRYASYVTRADKEHARAQL